MFVKKKKLAISTAAPASKTLFLEVIEVHTQMNALLPQLQNSINTFANTLITATVKVFYCCNDVTATYFTKTNILPKLHFTSEQLTDALASVEKILNDSKEIINKMIEYLDENPALISTDKEISEEDVDRAFSAKMSHSDILFCKFVVVKAIKSLKIAKTTPLSIN